MKIADKAGKLNGPGIREAFENNRISLKEFGGQVMNYTPADHRATSVVRVARIKNGKPVGVGEIDMKAKYPGEWPSWLGW
jgi:hypothetical protein